jgi:ribonuclease-3
MTSAGRQAELEERIGWTFRDPALLRAALTHRSYLNEVEVPDSEDNERLEFLGDALLDFVAGEFLFRRLPSAREGELTALRALLVCEPALAGFARRIDLGGHIRLGRGEATSGARERPALLCDAFEALVGALYLDAGVEAARQFVLGFIREETDRALQDRSLKDAKSLFQEVAQRLWQLTPQYRTVSESGPDHDKRFVVAVMVGDNEWGVGQGRSKSVAARRAAQAALTRLPRADLPRSPAILGDLGHDVSNETDEAEDDE